MADKDLSTYAHNIKIVAVNGGVTSNGTIISALEDSQVEAEARAVAGEANAVVTPIIREAFFEQLTVVDEGVHGKKLDRGHAQRFDVVDDLFLRKARIGASQVFGHGRVQLREAFDMHLTQTIIKLTAPGVPDFYQGTELWDVSLLDPENRRPVDYDKRARLLDTCRDSDARRVLSQWDSGLPKLWMIDRVLTLRAAHPEEFAEASRYQPI